MRVPALSFVQSNVLLSVAALTFATAALQTRVIDERICMLISLGGAMFFVAISLRGYTSRLSALVCTGIAILVSIWCAYGTWRILLHYRLGHVSGIDPFAGPLSILGLTACLSGLSIYIAGVAMLRKESTSFLQRFAKQRFLFALGALLLFSFVFFSHLLEGV
jgi:hypothetical protein